MNRIGAVQSTNPHGTVPAFAGEERDFWGKRLWIAFARDQFSVPQAWPVRIVLALLGLAVTVVLYLGSGLIPQGVRHIPVVAYLRYLVLVFIAVRVWPLVMERFSGPRT